MAEELHEFKIKLEWKINRRSLMQARFNRPNSISDADYRSWRATPSRRVNDIKKHIVDLSP